jgi:hypothetical protein
VYSTRLQVLPPCLETNAEDQRIIHPSRRCRWSVRQDTYNGVGAGAGYLSKKLGRKDRRRSWVQRRASMCQEGEGMGRDGGE